jgi:hypothetical protein
MALGLNNKLSKDVVHEYIAALKSTNIRERDLAVEYLGDILEHELHPKSELQLVISELGTLLEYEENELVIESILNSLSKSVLSKHNLSLPTGVVISIKSNLNLSAKIHADYIINNAKQSV